MVLPQALVHVVMTSSSAPGRREAGDAQSPVKISLFSLGNICQHAPCRDYLKTLDIVRIAQRLARSPDATVAKYATRILTRFPELRQGR
ncbi:MAG: hypothetical protein EBR88_08650 [Betaproteobacteria bacterium]|nr:hypothetical protein [Betaproteobacteria bacterium]